MDAWPTLSLVENLLREHALDRPGPRVVPCMHEQLKEDVELLRSAASRYDGILYDLDAAPDSWEDPAGPIASHRVDVIRGIESMYPAAMPAPLRFSESGGRVVGGLEGTTRKLEPSMVPVVRAASVVASSAYDLVDMVWLSVDMDPIDPTRAAFLWSLLTIDPTSLDVTGPKTVVPIIGGRVDADIDYSRDPEVRLVVRNDRVLRRSNSTTHSAIRGIVEHHEPLVLFLGAGASASAGIPLGNTYRDLALRDLLSVPRGTTPDALVDGFFEYLHDRDRFLPMEPGDRTAFAKSLTLERVLRETFHELGAKPRSMSPVVSEIVEDCNRALGFLRPGRQSIHDLAALLRGRLILITVNFDQLIETRLATEHLVSATPDEFAANLASLERYLGGDATQPVPILKLHGTVDRPETLIATIDDTQAGLHDDVRAALDAVIEHSPHPVTWAWIGCSMRDRDITAWLRGLGRRTLDEWWIDPLPSESLDIFFEDCRRANWDAEGRRLEDRLVVESADRFLRTLHAHAASIV
jgi:hypothetical protein